MVVYVVIVEVGRRIKWWIRVEESGTKDGGGGGAGGGSVCG